MRTRASFAIGAIALATCVICPVLEMFDQWDHTLQTGTDSEYIFVLIALCVGALFVLARLHMTITPNTLESRDCFAGSQFRNSMLGLASATAMTLVLESPLLTLRI